jgi:hypothetical protein
VRKLKFLMLATASVTALLFTVGCKKTTNNTTVVKDSIYYSSWAPLVMSFDNTDSVYFQDFDNSKITASVVSSGAVLGYFGLPNGSGDTSAINAAELNVYFYIEQQISTGVLDVSAAEDLSYANNGFLYRYVIIPGNVLANSSLKGLTQTQLQHMKFNDVEKALTNASTQSAGNKFNE